MRPLWLPAYDARCPHVVLAERQADFIVHLGILPPSYSQAFRASGRASLSFWHHDFAELCFSPARSLAVVAIVLFQQRFAEFRIFRSENVVARSVQNASWKDGGLPTRSAEAGRPSNTAVLVRGRYHIRLYAEQADRWRALTDCAPR